MLGRKTYEQELQERGVRQNRLDSIVQSAIQRVVTAIRDREPTLKAHFFYGATGIHPGHLVTWYLFHTDADWQLARESGFVADITRLTRAELAAGGYPAEGLDGFLVSFTSDEEIQRETGGDYWAYFK
jgi:hypothetical protein